MDGPVPTADLAALRDSYKQDKATVLHTLAHSGAVTRGLTRSALVAVQGSRGYWERHGYAVHALRNALQRQHLAAYGEGAVYMMRTLA